MADGDIPTSLKSIDLVASEDFRYRPRFERQAIVQLSALSGWRSIGTVAWQWTVIASAALGAVHFQHWIGYAFAICVIATRQQALGVLTHDAAHYRLCRSRLLNDMVSDFFLTFPFGGSTSLFRRLHFDHHRHLNSEDDWEKSLLHSLPDWQFPKTRAAMLRLFVRDIFGFNTTKHLKMLQGASIFQHFFRSEKANGISARERWSFVVYQALTLGTIFHYDAWGMFGLFWLAPVALLLPLTRLRMISEHLGTPNTSELKGTRTTIGSWFERMTICPLNINYHLEHHMFPTVPFFRLRRLHGLLMKDPKFAREAHVTKTYFGRNNSVMSELLC